MCLHLRSNVLAIFLCKVDKRAPMPISTEIGFPQLPRFEPTGAVQAPPPKRQRVSSEDEDGEKRELLSCIEGISVSEERRLLAEIRKLGLDQIDRETRLSNGMIAMQFAMFYVMGNRRKRQYNMMRSKEKHQLRKQENDPLVQAASTISQDNKQLVQ
jgi:hypothetical protein